MAPHDRGHEGAGPRPDVEGGVVGQRPRRPAGRPRWPRPWRRRGRPRLPPRPLSTCSAVSTATWDTRWGSWLTETPSHTTRAKPPGCPSTQRTPTASSLRQCVEPWSVTAATGPSTTSWWSRAGVHARCAATAPAVSTGRQRSPQPGQAVAPAALGRGPAIDPAVGGLRGSAGGRWPVRSGGPGGRRRAGSGRRTAGEGWRRTPRTTGRPSTTGSPQAGQPIGARRLRRRSSQQRPRSRRGWPGRPGRCARGSSIAVRARSR